MLNTVSPYTVFDRKKTQEENVSKYIKMADIALSLRNQALAS